MCNYLKVFVHAFVISLVNGLEQHPDLHLQTPDLVTKYGYPLEAHKVITEDGYILELHRIPFGRNENQRQARYHRRSPILLQHGLAGSSADWVITGPRIALAYNLADEGYDVWLGNNRGNIYSRHHRLMPPTNKTFWDFSYHELGMFDLPAMIDHILITTSSKDLLYLGHSQGTTQFWVMASCKPEYNSKIKLAIALAPVAYTSNLRGPITQLTKLTDFGVWVGERFGYPELGSRSPWGKVVSNLFCHTGSTQFFCNNLLFLVTDFNYLDIDLSNLTLIISHVPAGASWKQLVHYGQGFINPGVFRAFDYGDINDKNYKIYKSLTPIEYPLEEITAPVALFSSDNDWLAAPQDVYHLKSRLRNVILDQKIHVKSFNHYEFLWGTAAPQILFKPIVQLLKQYE